MPNVMMVLKEEIARIARKEAKAAVAPVRKPVPQLKRSVAELKKRMAALESANKILQGLLTKMGSAMPTPTPELPGRVRLTAKGIRSLRRKLRLSQEDFAKLVGVTAQAVYLWERKQGGLKLRKETTASLLAVRRMTGTEAAARLAESEQTTRAKKPARKRGKRK
jgi:DNA-binding transcriptional regulator YiaG